MTVDISDTDIYPFVTVSGITENEALEFSKREIMLKAIYSEISSGTTLDEAFQNLRDLSDSSFNELVRPYITGNSSIKIVYDSFGSKTYEYSDWTSKIYHPMLSCFRDCHPVIDLKSPDTSFYVIEDRFSEEHPNNPFPHPPRFLICREVAVGPRKLLKQFDLSKRRYIGTTSMKAHLSFICANLGLVRPGSLVLDPYCGTMSIGLSCAAFGGTVIGGDLDIPCIRGKPERNIFHNFQDQHLPRPDLVIVDQTRSPFALRPIFDAIITDPPYGIREGCKTIGTKQTPTPQAESTAAPSDGMTFQPTVQHSLSSTLSELLNFASQTLVMGGRLVFWVPSTKSAPNTPPFHPSLTFISQATQPLNPRWSRKLITMEKVREHEDYFTNPGEDDPFADALNFREFYFDHQQKSGRELKKEAKRNKKLQKQRDISEKPGSSDEHS
ncbi:putative tRNA guanosine-2'-O-methyltransferase [Blattamonas nauphoetae]|uniref:tRNA guanosine-2'-O-methyltransferase n=1 Tax=Blattamonas nauphoetae TaxID=2049346 RepID=A0ABQ9Y1X2_9EUKA|nr:putative tRNA guanosine-2'-O-methyltransferase [Blattamonas nauphoetae]